MSWFGHHGYKKKKLYLSVNLVITGNQVPLKLLEVYPTINT